MEIGLVTKSVSGQYTDFVTKPISIYGSTGASGNPGSPSGVSPG